MNKTLQKFLIAAGCGLLAFLCSFSGIFSLVDYKVTDAIYQRPKAINNNIKIIALDEKTLNEKGPLNTWSREIYADLLNELYEDEKNAPALVVFDVIFQGQTEMEADEALAEAAKNAGGVVAAANMVFSDAVETDEEGKKYLNRFHVDMVEYPYDGLLKNSRVGFADSVMDNNDGYVRMFFPKLSSDTGEISSLSMAAAEILSDKGLMDINIPNTRAGESLIIRYNGRPGDYESISLVDVLDGKIPKEALKGSVLFVGAYAPGMMDAFSVPTGNGMYGVEIHANILDSIGNGGYLVSADKLIYSLATALLVFVYSLLAQSLGIVIVAVIGLLLIIAEFVCGYVLSINHIFMPLITLVIAVVLICVGSLLARYLYSLVQKRKVLKAFSQYVSPDIVDEIAKSGDFKVKLGGERKDIAVLFVDIRGFTPFSEALEPEQIVEVLNEYLSLTTKAIFDNRGTVDKFVGDACMAVFNSPFDLEDYVYRAVCTARDIVNNSEVIKKKAYEMTGMEIGFGVGVNCGPAVVGNIGSEVRMDYTAIGDTVNTAARLESNAAAGQVLLSPAVVAALGDRIKVNAVGEISLKGKANKMLVYELIDV